MRLRKDSRHEASRPPIREAVRDCDPEIAGTCRSSCNGLTNDTVSLYGDVQISKNNRVARRGREEREKLTGMPMSRVTRIAKAQSERVRRIDFALRSVATRFPPAAPAMHSCALPDRLRIFTQRRIDARPSRPVRGLPSIAIDAHRCPACHSRVRKRWRRTVTLKIVTTADSRHVLRTAQRIILAGKQNDCDVLAC